MSEQKLEIFNVLNFLNSGYELEDILKQGNFGTFPSAQECIDYLVENGYLAGECGITAEDISKKYTVAELKEILRENNLTQVAFASVIGVKQSQVSEWLKGKAKPGYDTLKNMALAFNISADYFLGLKEY